MPSNRHQDARLGTSAIDVVEFQRPSVLSHDRIGDRETETRALAHWQDTIERLGGEHLDALFARAGGSYVVASPRNSIKLSTRIAVGRMLSAIGRPSSPSAAITTAYWADSRAAPSSARNVRLSSMIRIACCAVGSIGCRARSNSLTRAIT